MLSLDDIKLQKLRQLGYMGAINDAELAFWLEYIPGAASSVLPITFTNSNLTLTPSMSTVLVATSGADSIITLPSVGSNSGRIYTIKKTDAGAFKVVIQTLGNETTIDSSATYNLTTQNQSVRVQSSGIQWFII
jgi:hypothetical protein